MRLQRTVGTAQSRLCPPYGFNFEKHHLQAHSRDLAAHAREFDPEFLAF
jgi:hypothetical protein